MTIAVSETGLLDVVEAINTRRSIRKYSERPVTQADIETILELAGKAPSAWNLQPWRFVVVRDPAVKAELQAAAYGQAQVGSAPVVIVVYSDMQETLEHAEDVIHPDIAAAERSERADGVRQAFAQHSAKDRENWGAGQSYIMIGYLSLAARGLGFDTSLMLGFDADKVKALLDLPEHVTIPALIPLGERAEAGFPHHRHTLERITSYV